MTRKKCTKCLTEKPAEDFYLHNGKHLARCKACIRQENKRRKLTPEVRKKNAAANAAYREKLRIRGKTAKQVQDKRDQSRRWALNNPDKRKTQRKLHHELSKGRVVRPSICEQCKKSCKPDAHHEDYSKPLEVIWLCKFCHAIKNAESRRIAGDCLLLCAAASIEQ